jgi:hypothetical protein
MILTPISTLDLPGVLAGFRAALDGLPAAMAAFDRIAATLARRDDGAIEARRREAVALARSFGIPVIEEDPAAGFSWDGRALRVRSEPSVVIHEIAHWQLAAPHRRGLPDFGLGAGPETGRRAEADAARVVDDDEQQLEESLTSLLGILWEAELGHPAIDAFLEQNWLEAWQRPAAAENLDAMLGLLIAGGFADDTGRPTRRVRREPGPPINKPIGWHQFGWRAPWRHAG